MEFPPATYVAGLDWSGRPFQAANKPDFVVVCIAAFPNQGVATDLAARLRRRYGMAERAEFHGHKMSHRMVGEVLWECLEEGMRVGGILIENTPRPDQNPVRGTMLAASALFKEFSHGCLLHGLWCDEDIKGLENQKELAAAIHRAHRALHSNVRLKVHFRRSLGSDLIQMADVTAYALSWQARKRVVPKQLELCVKRLRTDPAHTVLGPVDWKEILGE